jgi:signal transduction histidine kinase
MRGTSLLGQAGLDAAGRSRRLAFLQLGPEDQRNLTEINALVREHVDEIVEAFYAHLAAFDETRRLLSTDAQVVRLKQILREYSLRMTEGVFDADYFESRLRVGDAHQRIDVQPQWYLGTYNIYLRLLIEQLRAAYRDDPDRLVALIESLSKVMFLDMTLAVEAYIMGGYVERALAQEYRRMAEVAERTLREKAEIERMKADLTNMIVHDLKGPLGGILTVTQLALRKRGAVADAHARRFEQIQRSARDLLRMIENLLEIDQMEGGRLELRIEPINVGLLLGECADEFRAAAEMSNQSLHVLVPDDVPDIATDRWLLRRILNNLVVNAIRHSGASGRIELGADYREDQVALRVSDAGRGIPLDEQPLLFVKHPRASARSGQSRDDTGLGLVFCKMAVDLLGGAIDVESVPGAGTIFTVTLPATIAPL